MTFSFFQLAADHFDVFPQEEGEGQLGDEPELDEPEGDGSPYCEGHESLRGDLMGEAFYCDGTCIIPRA